MSGGGDIYDIMVRDLIARRQADLKHKEDDYEEEEEDEEDSDEYTDDSDEEDEDEDRTCRRSVEVDEEERAGLKKKLSALDEDDGSGDEAASRIPRVSSSPSNLSELSRSLEPKAKEAFSSTTSSSSSISTSPPSSSSPMKKPSPPVLTIDRRWVSTTQLTESSSSCDVSPSSYQDGSTKTSSSSSPSSSPRSGKQPADSADAGTGSATKDKEKKRHLFAHVRHKPAHKSSDALLELKKGASPPSSPSPPPKDGSAKVRKRDIIRERIMSLREEKEELKERLHEWRAHRADEKKEREVDRELRRRTKEEEAARRKQKKKDASEQRHRRKNEEEWERRDRKAAEAYARKYGLEVDSRSREGVKCYTSFDNDEVDDGATPTSV